MSKAGTTADSKESNKFANLIGPTDPKLDREVRETTDHSSCGPVAQGQFLWQFGHSSQTHKCR
jgi:hypothetical protein